MEEIFEQFKDKDAFDAYWKEHYGRIWIGWGRSTIT